MSNDLLKAEYSLIEEFINDISKLQELDEKVSWSHDSSIDHWKKVNEFHSLKMRVYSRAPSIKIALQKLFAEHSQNHFT